MIPSPLRGRRVIDLSQYIAGPACAQLLADFGAEVIKVEPPDGDPSRALGRTRFGSVFFQQYNTGKLSRRIDLGTTEGLQELDQLLAEADAMISNFSARTRAKLGLNWDVVHSRHPHLTVVSISAYGVADHRTALDSVIQADSGFAAVNADEQGRPRITAGYPTDVFSGLYGGLSAAMALLDPTLDEGMLIDVPMIDVARGALLGPSLLSIAAGERPLPNRGNADAATAPSTIFDCADGQVYIYAGLDKHWELLRQEIDGPRGDATERLAQPGRYEKAVADWARSRTATEVLQTADRLGIAAAPVTNVDDLLAENLELPPNAAVEYDVDGAPVPKFPVRFDGAHLIRTIAP